MSPTRRPRVAEMAWDNAASLGLALPGVEARSSYGTPGLYVAKKFMARLREDDVMALAAIDDVEKEYLLATQPETFFVTDHCAGYPAILVRLSKVDGTQVKEMLARSWHRLAGKRLLAQPGQEVPVRDALTFEGEDA